MPLSTNGGRGLNPLPIMFNNISAARRLPIGGLSPLSCLATCNVVIIGNRYGIPIRIATAPVSVRSVAQSSSLPKLVSCPVALATRPSNSSAMMLAMANQGDPPTSQAIAEAYPTKVIALGRLILTSSSRLSIGRESNPTMTLLRSIGLTLSLECTNGGAMMRCLSRGMARDIILRIA